MDEGRPCRYGGDSRGSGKIILHDVQYNMTTTTTYEPDTSIGSRSRGLLYSLLLLGYADGRI